MILRLHHDGKWYADIPVNDIDDGMDIVDRLQKIGIECDWRLHDELKGKIQGRTQGGICESILP